MEGCSFSWGRVPRETRGDQVPFLPTELADPKTESGGQWVRGRPQKYSFRTRVPAPGPQLPLLFSRLGGGGGVGEQFMEDCLGRAASFQSGLITALLMCLVLESGGPNLRQTPCLALLLLSLSVQSCLSLPGTAPSPLSLSHILLPWPPSLLP